MSKETLTIVQKIALDAEISKIFLGCKHYSDKCCAAYLVLADRNLPCIDYKYEVLKNYIEEKDLQILFLNVQNVEIPFKYFINKIKDDISLAVKAKVKGITLAGMCIMPTTKEIEKSRFIVYGRIISKLDFNLAKLVFDCISFDDRLKFLAPSVMLLKEETSHLHNTSKKEPSEGLDKVTSEYIKDLERVRNNLLNIFNINYFEMDTLDLSTLFNQANEVGQENTSEENTANTLYVVNKKSKVDGSIIHQKKFKSKSEAQEYLNYIKVNYPNVLREFSFDIQAEKW